MPHHVMQQMEVMSASPYHTVSLIKVKIDNDPRAREVYKVGTTYIGDERTDLYTLSKVGLDRLMIACGMEEEQSSSEKRGERIWWARWEGTYVQPDGKPVPLGDEKEIDLRVGGTRWQRRVDKETDSLIKEEAKKQGIYRASETFQDFLVRAAVTIKRKDPDRFGEITELAEARADRFVNQLAQFGLELAKTGARLRAVRTVMEIKSYTLKELEEEFVVVRSRYDWDKLQAAVEPETRQKLAVAMLGRAFGVPEDVAIGLISAPEPTLPSEEFEEFAEDLIREEAERETEQELFPMEQEIFEDTPITHTTKPKPPSEPEPKSVAEPKAGAETQPASAFTEPIDSELADWLRENYQLAKFPNLGSLVGYVTGKTVGVEALSHGEGCNLRRFVEQIAIRADAAPEEIVNLKKNFKNVVLMHNKEQRLWHSDEEYEQLPLPI